MEGLMKGCFPQGKSRIGMLDMVKQKFTRKSKNMLLEDARTARVCYNEKCCNGPREVDRMGVFKPDDDDD